MGRVKDIAFRVGGAIALLTLVEVLFFIGAFYYTQIFLNKKILLSKPALTIYFFALFFLNVYILFVRGHGTKFEHEFDNLDKSRKKLLVTSCAVILVTIMIFFIYSAISYRHFFGIK